MTCGTARTVLWMLFVFVYGDEQLAPWAAMGNPCDASATHKSFMTTPIELQGCPSSPFADEATLVRELVQCPDAAADGAAACLAMRRGWRRAARTLTESTDAAGRTAIRHFAEASRAGAESVVKLLGRSSSGAPPSSTPSTIVPACQWAQNDTIVAVAVRFSPKKHGPVSVANVDEPDISLNATHVRFHAFARGKPLRFELELVLAARIVPEDSSWKVTGTAGRMTLQLVKEVHGTWPSLVGAPADGVRRGHVSTWFEMQQFFDGDGGEEDNDRTVSDAAERTDGKSSKNEEGGRRRKTDGKSRKKGRRRSADKDQTLLSRLHVAKTWVGKRLARSLRNHGLGDGKEKATTAASAVAFTIAAFAVIAAAISCALDVRGATREGVPREAGPALGARVVEARAAEARAADEATCE